MSRLGEATSNEFSPVKRNGTAYFNDYSLFSLSLQPLFHFSRSAPILGGPFGCLPGGLGGCPRGGSVEIGIRNVASVLHPAGSLQGLLNPLVRRVLNAP